MVFDKLSPEQISPKTFSPIDKVDFAFLIAPTTGYDEGWG